MQENETNLDNAIKSRDLEQVLSYLRNIEEVNHDPDVVAPAPKYPLRFYQLLYPTETYVKGGKWWYKFQDGFETDKPMDYIYLLELRRFNPNSNIAQSPEAAFIHQSLTAFHFHEGVDVLEKQPHYIRNNLYMQIRNLIEQLDLDSVVGLDKFPRHERLGLAKSIRDGYVELITVLNEGEQIPSLRKQSIKEFSKVLQNILCYYNFSYNRRYVSIHIVCRWAKRLAEISKLHDRYVKIILNKISTDTNEYT